MFGNFSFYSYKKACGQKRTVRGTNEMCAFMRCEKLAPAVKEQTVAIWEKLGASVFYLPGTNGEPRAEAGELLRWAYGLGARRGVRMALCRLCKAGGV